MISEAQSLRISPKAAGGSTPNMISQVNTDLSRDLSFVNADTDMVISPASALNQDGNSIFNGELFAIS